MVLILLREDSDKILGGRKMDRIIEAWIGTDAALETTCAPVDLPQKLNLQPALASLHHLGRRLCTRKLGDPQQADGRDQVD
jgi:hypothetical protein